MHEGDAKSAIEVLKLLVLAYPDSADAPTIWLMPASKLANPIWRENTAKKALAILNDHKFPGSS